MTVKTNTAANRITAKMSGGVRVTYDRFSRTVEVRFMGELIIREPAPVGYTVEDYFATLDKVRVYFSID